MTMIDDSSSLAFSLISYKKLSDHGFTLPLFASSPFANALSIAVPSRPADPESVIVGFQNYVADETIQLAEGDRRFPVVIGAAWLDVFLWNNEVYVGTRSEIWESISSIRSELEQVAPLSLLALADGARASNLNDVAAIAYRWLDRKWGDEFAQRWQINTYLRDLALRGLRRRFDSLSGQHSLEPMLRTTHLVRHESVVELRLPSYLWQNLQIDVDHLPDLMAASFGFGLRINIVRQQDNLDDFYENSAQPAVLLMRVSQGRGKTQTQIPFQVIEAFFGNDLVVRSGVSGKSRSMVLSHRDSNRPNTMKLEIPEMAKMTKPVVRFERALDGITYYVYDASSSEGSAIYNLLEAGLEDGSTTRARGNVVLWRVFPRADQI